MADTGKPLLIKRYASRRLYNTETSDYVTLEDIAGFIRAGRDVQIVDLKSGDDLTRQYLLQIVAEHESKGENVLPINVLTDLVRSYTTEVQSVVPQFLAMSFEMFRNGQSKMMENLTVLPTPMAKVPGFEDLLKQQETFMKTLLSGMPTIPGWSGSGTVQDDAEAGQATGADDLAQIKKQLAELQSSPAVDVVVATPGRLLDLSTPAQSLVPSAAGCIDLHEVRYVVLDEADKLLLSAGLAEQVATIHARTGGARQTLLFSATIPEGLPAAAAGLVNRPMVVDMQHVDMQRAADDGGEGAGRDGAVGAGGPWRAYARRIIEADEEAEDEGDDEPLITATTSDASFVVPSTIKQVVSICAEH
jgi:polyhydroxyalkanoate synthesis repressor PhaR